MIKNYKLALISFLTQLNVLVKIVTSQVIKMAPRVFSERAFSEHPFPDYSYPDLHRDIGFPDQFIELYMFPNHFKEIKGRP